MPNLVRCFRPLFLSSGFFLFSVASFAQSPTPATSAPAAFAGAPFAETAADLRAFSAEVPANTAQYGGQILLQQVSYTFAPDGTVRTTYRLIFRVDTKAVIDGWSEVSMGWDPWFENLAEIHARVLEPDGTFATLDQSTITDAPVKADDDDTYSSEHMRRAPLPGVAVGSIVEEVESVSERVPYMPTGGNYRFVLQNIVPEAVVRVVVDVPDSLPFADKLPNITGLDVQRSDANGVRHIVYKALNEPAAQSFDIQLATDTPSTPILEFSTGHSWQAQAAGYAKLADPQIIPSQTKAFLPANLPDDRTARLDAIVAKLHEEVRYTGVEFGASRIVPQQPAAVLERRYGDCKDKATLLVAMLREAGIPADLALLQAGPGLDVNPALPGLNEFNHAIVYVPAQGTSPAVWIDATAQYFTPGSLPYGDEGREALIIAPGTTGLTLTPTPRPEDSQLIETRNFTLSQLGPARVEEVSQTSGSIDARYRELFGIADAQKVHDNLESYVQQAYLAKSLVKVTHGSADDLSKPFLLTLNIDGAKRGTTELDDATVVLFPTLVLGDLPPWFGQQPPAIGPDTPPDKVHELELEKAAREPQYIFRPYMDERVYNIPIPDGFMLRALPPDTTLHFGPATLVESYAEDNNVITATYKFNTGSGVLTTDQALAMRDSILAFDKQDAVQISFDQIGAKEIAAGDIRAGLTADHTVVNAHPNEALPHVRLARALLTAGLGALAQAEARKATELDPKSEIAFETLGLTLEYDSFGRHFGKGFDRAGAIAAYKQAIASDATDNDPVFSLAVLDEYNDSGDRYAAGSNMAASDVLYRELIDRLKDSNPAGADSDRDNLLYTLYYQDKCSEAETMLASLPSSSTRATIAVACAAVDNGAQAALAAAARQAGTAGDQHTELNQAAWMLVHRRLYPQAVMLLRASLGNGGDDDRTERNIEFYKSMKRMELDVKAATNDPAAPVRIRLFGIPDGALTTQQLVNTLSLHAFADAAHRLQFAQAMMQFSGSIQRSAITEGMADAVLLDRRMNHTAFKIKGTDATGYQVAVTFDSGNTMQFYVVREDGEYRSVGNGVQNGAIGHEVLYALEHGNTAEAKAMLDWARMRIHRDGGDDPLEGNLFPRFWTINSLKPGANSPAEMRVAALSLMVGLEEERQYVPEIAALAAKASEHDKEDLELLLARAAVGSEDFAAGLPAAQGLLTAEPDSAQARELVGLIEWRTGHPVVWFKLLDQALARRPDDHDLLEQESFAYQDTGQFAKARAVYESVLASGQGTAEDQNGLAWLGLFDNHVGDEELQAAVQAVTMQENFSTLHTLACIYAAEGKTAEARQVLDKAETDADRTVPDANVWYALGLIDENDGETQAALAAYRNVKAHQFDDTTLVDPTSSYVLAQARIKALTQ